MLCWPVTKDDGHYKPSGSLKNPKNLEDENIGLTVILMLLENPIDLLLQSKNSVLEIQRKGKSILQALSATISKLLPYLVSFGAKLNNVCRLLAIITNFGDSECAKWNTAHNYFSLLLFLQYDDGVNKYTFWPLTFATKICT